MMSKIRGFTLIEVLVTMAIIAILAGMMVPAVYKWWESQEVQTTKERLNAIKTAMVGNRDLVQNGIRFSYGFVGDNGELPFANSSSSASLAFIVNRPPLASYPKWNGPYMSGFDPTEYRRDAWGNTFSYMLCKAPDNRYLSGALRSGGLNGKLDATYDPCDTEGSPTFCAGDDICLALNLKEVAPTNRIQGNFIFSNITGGSTSSAQFEVTFRNPLAAGGEAVSILSGCKPKNGPSFPNFTTVFQSPANPVNLPIGKVSITSKLYRYGDCTGKIAQSGTVDYFISDNLSSLLINLPAMTAP